MANSQLIQHFMQSFSSGESYKTITAARRQAVEILGEAIPNGLALTKLVDESIEAALVRVARQIMAESSTSIEAYDRLVNLYQRQPALNVRSSTSILQQAYSTPLPIAFLASQLAQITPDTSVYEPTGGNGALLIQANASQTTVNEINPDRAAELRSQGYTVTELDATSYQPEKQCDRIICNPPFGVVKHSNGRVKQFELPGSRRGSTQIDQVIALRALETMKAEGRAVLILGSKLGEDDERRSERYNSLESRSFFRVLYDQYNVTQHISIQGALYRKQGAGFPIDLIVIEGRGKSSLTLPAARVPPIFKSFDDLKELMPHEPLHNLSQPVETGSGRLSSFDASPSAFRATGNEQGPILEPDGRTARLDDSTLDERRGGEPNRNPPSPLPSVEPVEFSSVATGSDGFERGISGSRFLDSGVDRHLSETQRHPETTNLGGIPRGDPTAQTARSNGAMGFSPRHDESRRMAPRLDPEHDERRILVAGGQTMTDTLDVQAIDVPYIPRSQGRIAETIIPTNMAAAAQKALDKLEQAVGDIDEFVQSRLGYDSKEQLWQHFYAEQIDATALSFYQRDRGNIFLNGDQTGNGKGRFGAANLIDASRQGFIPIFVTQKSNLYNSMLNDVADIGRANFRVFATDNNLKIRLDDGRRLTTGNIAEQEAEMRRIMQEGFGQQYNAIFTTYSQLQAIGNVEPFRREFFRAIAPRAVFVFDEAHEAGGVSKIGAWKTNAPPNRADFVRELVDLSAGSVFMSATSIKNSAVVDLYARRSDAQYAVERIDNLEKILRDGGVPLQQMFASKFVAAGQMVRRGRSMSGISFDSVVVSVDRDIAESISTIMRSINSFDEAKQAAVKELGKQLKAEAKAISQDNSTGQVAVQSTSFTSLMHNAIDQSLLAQKAEATVQSLVM
jgi:P-loop containing NTP hydrolase pore-1